MKMKSNSVLPLSRASANWRRKCLLLAAIALLLLPSTSLVNAQVLYIVNTTSDTVVIGACQNGNPGCSLRGAIQAANVNATADGISIEIPASDPNCVGGNCTINLTAALPDLSTSMSITGPGPDMLTVQRSTASGTPNFRIFNVTTVFTVTISGMTIRGGNANFGGGIQNFSSGTVNVTNCRLSSNVASGGGGGIFNSSSGTVNVTNSTLSSNVASGFGGGIFNSSTGTVNVTNSRLTRNRATAFGANSPASGGGIYNNSTGTVNVTNSTLDNNFAEASGISAIGGGIFNRGTVNVTNSTLNTNGAVPTGIGQSSTLDASGGGIFNKTAQ